MREMLWARTSCSSLAMRRRSSLAFSFSSVEHFGNNEQIKRAMREAHRVLKPGGIYVLAVDYAFQCPQRRWWQRGGRDRRSGLPAQLFTRDEVTPLLIDAAGFRTVEALALDVPPADIPDEK